MKKFISTILVATCALVANAQNFTSQSFIANDITWLTVSNNVFGVTNLYSFVSRGTNAQGLSYTNAAGSRVIIGPGTNDYKNLLTDQVALWADSLGRWYAPTIVSNQQIEPYSQSPCSVTIRLVGKGSGAGNSICFNFVPVYDGTRTNESNQAAELWAVAVSANGTTPVVISTNVPLWKWPGSKGLRLREIYDSDTSSEGTWIQSVKFVGFRP